MERPYEEIIAAIGAAYAIEVRRIAPLDLGNDINAQSFRVEAADGAVYFLKRKRGVTDGHLTAIPYALQQQGNGSILAPIPTVSGTLSIRHDGNTLLLYPFIDGASGWEHPLSIAQWRQFGRSLRQVHDSVLPPELIDALPQEEYIPSPYWDDLFHNLFAGTYDLAHGDETARQLHRVIEDRRDQIVHTLRRAAELGRRLQQNPLPNRLCHSDIHLGNVMVDAGDRLWLVDWDQTMRAPRERDLIFPVGSVFGFVEGSADEDAFFAGYGQIDIDPLAIAYYRYARAIDDLGDYLNSVIRHPDLDEAERAGAFAGLLALFEPDQIFDASARADHL